jgi:hypothetical protein
MPVHIPKDDYSNFTTKNLPTNAAMLPEQTFPPVSLEFLAKTGLLIRPVDPSSLDTLFGELERYDG